MQAWSNRIVSVHIELQVSCIWLRPKFIKPEIELRKTLCRNMLGYIYLLLVKCMHQWLFKRTGLNLNKTYESTMTKKYNNKAKIGGGWWGRLKNTYELFNLRAPTILLLHKHRIFQCMCKIFCVEFHTKYLAHTLSPHHKHPHPHPHPRG